MTWDSVSLLRQSESLVGSAQPGYTTRSSCYRPQQAHPAQEAIVSPVLPFRIVVGAALQPTMKGLAGRLQQGLGCYHSSFNSSGTVKHKCKAPKQAAERTLWCQAAVGVTTVKLPATHLEASQRALEEIRATSAGTPNSEQPPASRTLLQSPEHGSNAAQLLNTRPFLPGRTSWICTHQLHQGAQLDCRF